MQKKLDLLSTLLRDFENELGTSELFLVILKAMTDSLNSFKPENEKDFYEQFENLVFMFCNTKPKFGIFRYYFQKLHSEFKKLPKNSDLKEFLKNQINKIKEEELNNKKEILKFSDTINVSGKSILIYEQSNTIKNILKRFKSQKKEFNVIVAEQQYEKTHNIIEFLHNNDIPFQVVPDYMLSHIDKNVDFVFFGALTLKDTMEFVMPTGSHSVVSAFQTMNIPVYMFLQTAKFSLWRSEERNEIYHRKETRKHHSKPINYERLKFSHDRVSTSLFHKIITEKGIFSPEELKDLFKKNYKK